MTEPAETDDAHAAIARTLRLLWEPRTRPASKRGPKPKLDLDRVVAAAIALADAEGLAAISMQKVADRLDIGVASLYTYVPGKPALLAVMLDTAVGWSSLPHELPGGWRQQFEAWAREDWRVYREHPWVMDLAARSPTIPGPRIMDWMESALRVLAPTGLDEAATMAVVNAIDGYVRSAARDVGEGVDAHSAAATRARDELIDADAMARRYPNVTRVVLTDPALFGGTDPEFGLARLLDGVERFIAERAAE